MQNASIKLKAIELRKSGLSYGEIRKEILVSKSTLSVWLKSIALSEEYRSRLYTRQIEILSRGSQSQKARRAREIENIIQAAESEIPLPLSFETYRLMGAAIYWAEGSKRKMFEFTNSDPSMILFFTHWMEKIFGIPPQQLRICLNIYSQQNELEMKKFWSELTGIPLTNFGKSFVKPLSKNYKKNNLYYGTAKIYVPKSTDIRHRVFGWIKGALKDIESNVAFTERRWQSLRETQKPVNLKTAPPS